MNKLLLIFKVIDFILREKKGFSPSWGIQIRVSYIMKVDLNLYKSVFHVMSCQSKLGHCLLLCMFDNLNFKACNFSHLFVFINCFHNCYTAGSVLLMLCYIFINMYNYNIRWYDIIITLFIYLVFFNHKKDQSASQWTKLVPYFCAKYFLNA